MPIEAVGTAYDRYSMMIGHLSVYGSLLTLQLLTKFCLPAAQEVRWMPNEFAFSIEVG